MSGVLGMKQTRRGDYGEFVCLGCGQTFPKLSANTIRCRPCAKIHERMMNTERKRKYDEAHKFDVKPERRIEPKHFIMDPVKVVGYIPGWHTDGDALDFKHSRFGSDDFFASLRAGCFPSGLVVTHRGRTRVVQNNKLVMMEG